VSPSGPTGPVASPADAARRAAAGLRWVRPLSFGPAVEVWQARLDGRPVIARRQVAPPGGLPWPQPPDPAVLSALRHPALARHLRTIRDPDGTRVDLYVPVPGTPLSRHLRAIGPLPARAWIPALRDAAVGLRWLHGRCPGAPRLHGDVAPSNLVLTPAGRARWIDVDALPPGTAPAGPGIVWGTLPFLAPEVLAGDAPDCRAEVHSLALVALAAALGRLPWEDARAPRDVLAHPARRDAAALATTIGLPATRADLLARMLADDPAARPTMEAVVRNWPRT
jgi:serine/threonine-protein kinase